MLCENPFMRGSIAFGCGQCMPCRYNRRKLWTHRIMLESYSHSCNSFLTLTYDRDHLPPDGSLVASHFTDFIKRLRYYYKLPIRYFGVGEYGDQSERPHYHAALFGLGPQHIDYIKKSWNFGFCYLGDLTFESAQYVAGYVTKKMTSNKNEFQKKFLKGRLPEFSRQSRRPGIGAGSMETLVDFMVSNIGADELLRSGDVPQVLQHGKKKYPLGRYLRDCIRKGYGFKELGAQEGWKNVKIQEMQELFKKYGIEKKFEKYIDKKLLLQKENSQKILNFNTRQKIFSKKGSI